LCAHPEELFLEGRDVIRQEPAKTESPPFVSAECRTFVEERIVKECVAPLRNGQIPFAGLVIDERPEVHQILLNRHFGRQQPSRAAY
jgi:hypothetical protein